VRVSIRPAPQRKVELDDPRPIAGKVKRSGRLVERVRSGKDRRNVDHPPHDQVDRQAELVMSAKRADELDFPAPAEG